MYHAILLYLYVYIGYPLRKEDQYRVSYERIHAIADRLANFPRSDKKRLIVKTTILCESRTRKLDRRCFSCSI